MKDRGSDASVFVFGIGRTGVMIWRINELAGRRQFSDLLWEAIVKADIPFLFGDADKFGEQTFALHIPKGLQDKYELLSCYEEAGKFPDYFGRN